VTWLGQEENRRRISTYRKPKKRESSSENRIKRGGGNNLRRLGCLKERTEEREMGSGEKQGKQEREELLRK
jgi:hypothetical protein